MLRLSISALVSFLRIVCLLCRFESMMSSYGLRIMNLFPRLRTNEAQKLGSLLNDFCDIGPIRLDQNFRDLRRAN